MRTQHSLLISLFLLIFLPATAYAEIYKWVDGDGKIQFGDERPLGSESENVKLTINTFANVSFKIADEATKKEVIMYTTSWCGYCKKARRHLEQEKIAYTVLSKRKSLTPNMILKKIRKPGQAT